MLSWKTAYRGALPDDYLDALEPRHRVPQWEEHVERTGDRVDGEWYLRVAVDKHGVIQGFTTAHLADDGEGELASLYLTPESFGTGMGDALMDVALTWLRAQGCTRASLWVVPANTRARRFYERHGWQHDDIVEVEYLWGVNLPGTRYLLDLR